MFVFRLIDMDNGECKYIDASEDIEKWLMFRGKYFAWMLSAKWRIEYLKAASKTSAQNIAEDIRKVYPTIFNKTDEKEAGGGETEKVDPGLKEWADGLEWAFYGEADFSEVCCVTEDGSGEGKLGSAKVNILLLAAMAQGLVGGDICKEICGGKYIYRNIMANFKEKKEAEIVYGKTPRMVHILRNGCEVVEPLVPGSVGRFGANLMPKRSGQRKYDISATLYILQLTGAQIIPVRKPPFLDAGTGFWAVPESDAGVLTYAPYEVKQNSRDELLNSRMSAVAVTSDSIYVLYHMGGRNMKFNAAIESRAWTVLKSRSGKRRVQPVILAKSGMLEILLENWEIKKRLQGGQKLDMVTPDMNMEFVPADDCRLAAAHMAILLRGDKAKLEMLEKAAKGNSRTLISLLPLNLLSLLLLAQEKNTVSVLCSEALEPYIKKICPAAEIRAVKNSKLAKLVRRVQE